ITIESGGSGGITLGGQVGNATSQITLTTPGTGSITSKTAAAVVTGQTVAVNSSGGSIGTASAPLKVAGNDLTFTTSLGGLVNVDNNAPGAVTLNTSAAGTTFSLSSTGNLNVNSITTSAGNASNNGSIRLIVKTGSLTVLPNSNIEASGGNIFIQSL